MVAASRALFFFVSILSTFANPAPRSTLSVHERRDSVPRGFTLKGPASPDTSLTLSLVLTSNNLLGLESALYDVSTPGSKLYGQHLSKEEVCALIGATLVIIYIMMGYVG